ncbi:MAG: PDZ domain-containing protein, partial [Bacilli bacterium]|nr:PDZ domain-containing protein [Bacilli bacterium]
NLKNKIKENKLGIIIILLIFMLLNIRLPYIVNVPGGVIDVIDRVEVNSKIDYSGSLNMTYVRTIDGIIPTLAISFINPKWDIVSKKQENGTSTDDEAKFMDKINLESSIDYAIITAFKNSNKKLIIKDKKIYVTYIFEEAKTNLKVGDEIKRIDNLEMHSKQDIKNYIKSKNIGDKISISVLNNNKKYIRNAQIIEVDNTKLIGIMFDTDYNFDINPKVNVKFEENETGPSGGLMLALTIYSKINNIDITHGKKISGTGTIDEYGNVGEIGGVKYKLAGAIKNKMDIFLVPKGDNYKTAIKEKENNHYDIEIYGVDSFKDAIQYLKELD